MKINSATFIQGVLSRESTLGNNERAVCLMCREILNWVESFAPKAKQGYVGFRMFLEHRAKLIQLLTLALFASGDSLLQAHKNLEDHINVMIDEASGGYSL